MIYFLRHGLDDENFVGGWSDVDLIDEGIKQVEHTVEIMDENGIIPSSIIASNVRRAEHTAKIVSEHFGTSYTLSDDFREQSKGLLNGMEKIKAEREYPEYMSGVSVDTVYPDGESLKMLYERMKKLLPYIASLDDDTLIVTHRGVINMLYFLLNDIPLDMDKKQFKVTHASLHELDGKRLTIRKVI